MSEGKVYDLIIAGAGPAGISAAIYGVRKGLDLIVVTGDIGGQTIWSGDIENYAGFHLIKGSELVEKLEEHLNKYSIEVREQELIKSLHKKNDIVEVKTAEGVYRSTTAIVATGKTYNKLEVPGEEEFQGKGVAYCATCDAPFFAGKTVAVAGGGNSAFETAEQLMKITKKTYIIDLGEQPVADKVLREKVLSSGTVQLFSSSVITEIKGDTLVNGIVMENSEGKRQIDLEGVFVEIGLRPNSDFDSDLDKKESGEIRVNNCNMTNLDGVFASGDVTDVPHKQIIVAAGEGAKAALSAYSFLTCKSQR